MTLRTNRCARLLAGIGLIMTAVSAAADETITPGPQVEQALLAEDWRTLADIAQATDALTAGAVMRAVRGHSLLMMNRNDELLLLFRSLAPAADRQAWRQWTADFVARYPKQAVAHYLHGDALARLAQPDAALQSFDLALGHQPARVAAPALIATGVILAGKGKDDQARATLKQAVLLHDELAEAHISLSNLLLLRRAPKGAQRSFTRALQHSPDAVLALNGLGCAEYGLGHWDKAQEVFVKAAERLPVPLFLGNLRALRVADENLHLAGLKNSPLFRFSDFLDWAALRLDDLAVALRARLVHDDWPMVSIDPVASTARTGQQQVRLKGGIAATRFGQDLLAADIFLKRYSLEAVPAMSAAPSYRSLVDQATRQSLARQRRVRWAGPVGSGDGFRGRAPGLAGLAGEQRGIPADPARAPALSWTLPLDRWEMPNGQDLTAAERRAPAGPGLAGRVLGVHAGGGAGTARVRTGAAAFLRIPAAPGGAGAGGCCASGDLPGSAGGRGHQDRPQRGVVSTGRLGPAGSAPPAGPAGEAGGGEPLLAAALSPLP